MMRVLLLCGMLFCASGCAKLSVEVDALNPGYLRAATEASALAQGGHARADEFIAASRSELLGFRDRCFNILIAAELARATDASLAQSSRDLATAAAKQFINVRNTPLDISSLVEPERLALYSADDKVFAALGIAPSGFALNAQGKRGTEPGQLEKLIGEREFAYSRAANRFASAIRENYAICPFPPPSAAPVAPGSPPAAVIASTASGDGKVANTVESAKANATANIEGAKYKTIIGGGMLLKDSPEAYFVASADPVFWAPRYNRAFGDGWFGSTSIAIKMNDTADFSIKGFVFDGRSTAEMVKKIGIQAVATIAAAYGAPVLGARPAGATTGQSLSYDPTKLIAEPQAQIDAANASEAAYRSALLQLADAMIANWQDLHGGSGQAEQTVEAIFNGHKTPYLSPTP